ncbi:amidophosphoribosyltransferase [Saprospiraceae bacterium]|nr:amidophosphoribosyltransferase [Saprospiraceae bacterium]
MSEEIKHECGLAFIRLLKPLEYYKEKYGTNLYGLNKLQLLLQKQRNRGQDGAGLATIKLDMPPGHRYISRKRSNSGAYLKDLWDGTMEHFKNLTPEQLDDTQWLKYNKPYIGELLLGHLRYGTHGVNTIETCHPFLRSNNWISRNLVLAGNFNMTNMEELFQELVSFGQNPKEKSDTVTVLEKIGHFLDDEVQRNFSWFKPEGFTNVEINEKIAENLDVQRIIQRSARKFDGGYIMAGMIGHGDAFVFRDPSGIRPAYYYADDEVVVAASERPAIQTAFDVHFDDVKELTPGHALIVKKNGYVYEPVCKDPKERTACSFERIYFARGTDRDIYLERKKLGELLTPQVMKAINHDLENSVFSFIPNTAETSFYGLVEGLEKAADKIKSKKINEAGAKLVPEELEKILSIHPRVEKLAVKDAKMRTFIADDASRAELVNLVYDVTYGIVKNEEDTLVLIDDSIVRGTTLRDSILSILSRLRPKKIIILSSAPQIRYPDCYGIDMSMMKDFCAFQALIALLKDNGKEDFLNEIYQRCKAQEGIPDEDVINHVQELYAQFTYDQVTDKICEILTPKDINCEVQLIYQTIESLHEACPDNNGDWYFSGNYPTPGGNRVVNKSFINYMEKRNERAY